MISIALMIVMGIKLVIYLIVFLKQFTIQQSVSGTLPITWEVGLIFGGTYILLIGSILAFRGGNIGRWLIIGWAIFALVFYHDYLLPRMVWLAVAYFMLFNKRVNQFMRQKASKEPEPVGEIQWSEQN